MWPFKRCNHDWKVINEVKEKSFIERTNPTRVRHMHYEYTQGTHILTCTCTKCGKFKQTVNKY